MSASRRPLLEPCPCGLPTAYADCCGRYHPGGVLPMQAPTPEALMRSRYTAFVKDIRPYLMETWHPTTRPVAIDPPEPGLKWLGLTIKSAPPPSETRGRVAFVARFKTGGRAQRLEEISDFVREQEQWYYLSAVEPGG